MFLRLLAIETRKTLKHPALWLGLLALLLLLAMFVLVSHLQIANGYRSASAGLEKDLLAGLGFYSWICILVYAVLASVIAAFDYPDRSIQLWLTRGVARPLLWAARLSTILFFALMMTCFTIAALLGFGALSRTFFWGAADASTLDFPVLLPLTLRIFWSGMPYLALTVLFAVISRSPLVAAGATVVYGTIVETLALGASHKFPTLVRYLPVSLSHSLQAFNTSLDRSAPPLVLTTGSMPEIRSILMIGMLSMAISMASLVIFSHQDLGG